MSSCLFCDIIAGKIPCDNAIPVNRDIAIGLLHQLTDKVIDVSTDVASFGKLGSVRFDKRNADHLGDVVPALQRKLGLPVSPQAAEQHPDEEAVLQEAEQCMK